MKGTLADFASHTTAHGWGNVSQRKTTLSKTIWIILCLGCTGVAVWQVVTIILRYAEFDTKDRIILDDTNIEFPSVTVCPLIGISETGRKKLFQDLNDEEESVTQAGHLSTLLLNFSTLIDSNISRSAYSEKVEFYEEFYNQLYSYQGYFENMNTREYSHKLEEFIPLCSYQGKSCSQSDFHSFDHHEYYQCFTFNGVNTTIADPYTKVSGPEVGLSLTLFLDLIQGTTIYNPRYPTSGSQGVRVVIHEKGTLAYPEKDGFDIEPGHSVNAALSVHQRQLMKPPWGECAHTSEMYGGYTYTKSHCILNCLQKLIYKTCGCIKSSLPLDNETAHKIYCLRIQAEEWLKLNTSQFNLTLIQNELESLRCQKAEYAMSGLTSQGGCQCQEKCTYQSYEMTLSQSQWPMEGVEIDFYCRGIMSMNNYTNSSIYNTFHDIFSDYCGFVKSEDENKLLTQTYGDQVRKNFIRLNVYFKDLETKIVQQTEDFSINSMISEIGGSFGFFIGMSVITIAEVILLCWNIILVIRNKILVSPSLEDKEVERKHAWPDIA